MRTVSFKGVVARRSSRLKADALRRGRGKCCDQSLTIPGYFPDTESSSRFGRVKILGLAEKFPGFALPEDFF